MRFYMLYSNQFATGNKPMGIASLAAVAKNAGHDFRLFDCTNYSLEVEALDWNDTGLKMVEFRELSNPERLPRRPSVSMRELLELLLKDIDDFKPDVIGLSVLTDDYPLGVELMREIRKAYPDVPTAVGGVHATVDPANVLREPCFDMVCVGEGEEVILDICERAEKGSRDFANIPNLWTKNEAGEIVKSEVRPLITALDDLPFPDWTIYGEPAFYKPFDGIVYKYGDFEMSRGCPYKCSYCINVQLQHIYAFQGASNYHREKSIPRLVEEIVRAKENYGIEFLKFWDETFLNMTRERMEEFRDLYRDKVGLPYVCETTAQSINEFSAQVLSDTQCRAVSVGIETGSPDLRRGILHKPTDNRVYKNAYRRLRENGIQGVSFNMIGLPTESQRDVFKTIGLNRLVGTKTQSVGIFYPYKGTPIRDMMVKKGLMDEDFEYANLEGFDFSSFTSGSRSVVIFKDMDSRLLNRFLFVFSVYSYVPVKLFPLVDYTKDNENPFSTDLLNELQRLTYYLKFQDMPDDEDLEGAEFPGKGMELPDLGDEKANWCVRFIIDHWHKDGLDRVLAMIDDIAAGRAKPQYDLPEDEDALEAWLDARDTAEGELRELRNELRAIAKTASEDYVQASC